jgi:hypothetical protein
MRRNQERLLGLSTLILAVLVLSPALLGQASSGPGAAAALPTDWSHQQVIFSRPANAEQAKRVERDPRYWQQIARQSPARLNAAERGGARSSEGKPGLNGVIRAKTKLGGDWSQDLGSGGRVGAGQYPAKFSFQSTVANCAGAPQPDFTVFGTGLVGSIGQATIAAFDNLYSGCTGTVPTVYWAYDTAGGTAVTSPVLSRDGTQIAFMQRNSLSHGILVLLKWAASTTDTISTPTTLTRVLLAAYPTCTAPCMTTIAPRDIGSAISNDTNSSVFYDYGSDTAYVGDDAGFLHKFTPVFNGIPAEVRTGGWPVQLSTTALNSPVHDFATGNVFVTDNGGFLYLVDSSTAAVTISGQLDFSALNDGGPGIVQGPIVDSTSGLVYVFAPSDGSVGCIGGTDCTAVYQLTTSFASGDFGSEAVVGASTIPGSPPSPLYIGAFDSTYRNSVDGTGNLYVCGNTGGDPVLYQVAIGAGAFGTVTAGPVLSTSFAATPCSPVTDILNSNVSGGATEWMFASTQNGGASSGCSAGGCIFNFKDTPWLPSTTYAVGQEVLDSNFQIQVVSVGGTSGATVPTWSTTVGSPTPDGTVVWLDQGVQSAFTPAAWQPVHLYALHEQILDGNNNIQFATTPGTSGGSMPTFNSTAGGTTIDGVVVWTNLGALGTAALAAAGGTSGIVIDNIVGSATEPGASQIYFSTLSNQTCGTSGTGGCAVQASQSALQ